ncbi:MAG: hypothetical protein A2583_13585 [Bdellovibrionales bacterium RIFOXYD1_FULL_53_11]|nr:MAG: hypothetical protein A2583_13585 [Bdellovibrionales bacterium RIFOXYD1_FULL_53_11]
MKRVGGLFDNIASFENILAAAKLAMKGKKSSAACSRFYLNLENEVIELVSELKSGRYRPMDYKTFTIYEPKERKICCSHIRDRVVHHAACKVIEPYFEKRLIFDSYACRVGKGTHAAIGRCRQFSRGHGYYLKCDIKKYFDSIDHDCLKRLLARIFKDDRLLRLLSVIIDHVVPGAAPGKGLPIGNLTSQHYANLYLGELDHFVKEKLQVRAYLRYMDDYLLFHDSKEFLKSALEEIRRFVGSALLLRLKEEVVHIAPVAEGVPFLGFRVFPGLIRVQRKNLIRMRRKIAAKERAVRRGSCSEEEQARSIQSTFAHMSHANVTMLLRREVLGSLYSV